MKRILSISIVLLAVVVVIMGLGLYNKQKIARVDNVDSVNTGEIVAPDEEVEKIEQNEIQVPILVYHSVRPAKATDTKSQKEFNIEPERFIEQLRYLKTNGYTGISYDDLVAYFDGEDLPEKPIIISFDDGWKNQYEYAFPILKAENFTATFFIFTNAIGHDNYFSWDQLKELQQAGMKIGSHSRYHPYLWKITDNVELEKEIIGSKETIESQLGETVTVFAYPFGIYSSSTIDMVKSAGYSSARSGDYGTHHTKNDLFTLRSVQAVSDMKYFAERLNSIK